MGLCALHSVRRAHLSFWKAVWTIDLVPSPRDAGRELGRGARNLLSPGPLLHCVEDGLATKKRTQKLCNSLVNCFGFRSQWANGSQGNCAGVGGCKTLL